MRLTFTLFIFLLSTLGLQAQWNSKLSSELNALMQGKKRGGNYHILIKGAHQINFQVLKAQWKQDGLSLTERRKETIKVLMAQKRANQDVIIQKAESDKVDFEIDHVYWLSNVVTLHAPAQSVRYFANLDMVEHIELVEEQMASPHLPIQSSKPVNQRAINGIETGLSAVKAPELWSMGYSGKGTKVLSFDTGIWPDHPSFRDKFLGHHFPMNEAWYGYDSFYPTDKSGSHGSHTSGTVMGLDANNNDTIGVAFNAYLMATDPIVGLSVDIKPLSEIALAYEWAMNPDGDTLTVDDMPDVINNSWGHTFDPINDSAACSGFFADVLVAVEAADIISIQSAGNSGPADSTVGAPSLANMTLVNNFSVGAVNGHNSSYPIASFSSRGPSHCPSTGAFAIKPEVVAPGVNVRSAVRNNSTFAYEYSNFQGTSMAAPHVSGIALLLREAFPMATAEEIKESLYYTAIDLGVSGEDNTYGRGMIDGLAAFNYLAQNYTPINPSSSPLDLNIQSVDLGVAAYTCDTVFTPKVVFNNTNPVSFGLVSIEYGFVGETLQYWSSTTGFIQPNDTLTLNPISSVPGWKEFYVRIDYTGGMAEDDYLNNARYIRFKIQDQLELPYLEDFEAVHPYLSSMHVEDFDQVYTWDSAYVYAPSNSSVSAFVRHSRYSPRKSQLNNLITPVLKMPTDGPVWMTFDLSYQFDAVVFRDSLRVWVSSGCNGVFDQLVYVKGPEDLNTTTKPKVVEWRPEDASDWRKDSVDLSAFANGGEIMVKIESVNNQGNNLYIDNINIYDAGGPVSVKEQVVESNEWKVFPNPATHEIRFEGLTDDYTLTVYNLVGKEMITQKMNGASNNQVVSIEELPKGVYFLRIQNQLEKRVAKFIKE